MPPASETIRPPVAKNGPSATGDPFSDPVAYLKAHGWKPLGNPDWPTCLWIDETRSLFPSEKRVEKLATFLKAGPGGKGAISEMRQVKQRVANAAGHVEEIPVQQIQYTPGQTPVVMQEALLQVMEKEHRDRLEAEKKNRPPALAPVV